MKPHWSIGYHFVVLCGVIVFTWAYVSSESGIYWWDYANYSTIAHNIVVEFRQSPLLAWQAIIRSLSNNYNAVFTIPLLPFLLLLGESRLVYEIGLVTIYLFPYALVVGKIAEYLFPIHRVWAYWIGVGLTLLTPSIWAPTLRGYPDVGAATCVALALYVGLCNWSQTKPWSIFLMGILLAYGMVLRRHFVYAALSFCFSLFLWVTIYYLYQYRHGQKRKAWHGWLISLSKIGLIGLVVLGTLWLAARPFLNLVITNDFTSLYASYMRPWYVVWERFAAAFGWIVFVVSWSGCLSHLVLLSREISVQSWAYIFGIVSASVWILGGRQLGNHYSLHFALLILLGMFVIIWEFLPLINKRWRLIAVGILGGIVLVNFIFGLTSLDPLRNVRIRNWFAQNWPPVQRDDISQLAQLVKNLRILTQPDDLIYVVGASSDLNRDLISNVERYLYGWEGSYLQLVSSDVDSRDPYPLAALLKAQVVLVADPPQLQLEPDQQKVVLMVHDLFEQDLYLAQDFNLLTKEYLLKNGIILRVYLRHRLTSYETAAKTLSWFQQMLPSPSVSQPEWIMVDNFSDGLEFFVVATGQYRLYLTENYHKPSVAILLLGPPEPWSQMHGEVDFMNQECGSPTFKLWKIQSEELKLVMSKNFISTQKVAYFDHTLPYEGTRAFLLLIDNITNNPATSCELKLSLTMD